MALQLKLEPLNLRQASVISTAPQPQHMLDKDCMPDAHHEKGRPHVTHLQPHNPLALNTACYCAMSFNWCLSLQRHQHHMCVGGTFMTHTIRLHTTLLDSSGGEVLRLEVEVLPLTHTLEGKSALLGAFPLLLPFFALTDKQLLRCHALCGTSAGLVCAAALQLLYITMLQAATTAKPAPRNQRAWYQATGVHQSLERHMCVLVALVYFAVQRRLESDQNVLKQACGTKRYGMVQ